MTPSAPLDPQIIFNFLRATNPADYIAAVDRYARDALRGLPPYPVYEDHDARRVRLCRSAAYHACREWEAAR